MHRLDINPWPCRARNNLIFFSLCVVHETDVTSPQTPVAAVISSMNSCASARSAIRMTINA